MSADGRIMKVRDVMTRDPITVEAETAMGHVKALMKEASIRHVPVVDDKGLLGVVSDRDLSFIHGIPGVFEGVKPEDVEAVMEAPVKRVMKSRFLVERDVETVQPDTMLKKAIDRLLVNKVGTMPVVDEDGEVVGVLSVVDVMRWVSDDVL